jgi:hypothetical protein
MPRSARVSRSSTWSLAGLIHDNAGFPLSSSARTSSDCGTVMPSALAVLMLITGTLARYSGSATNRDHLGGGALTTLCPLIFQPPPPSRTQTDVAKSAHRSVGPILAAKLTFGGDRCAATHQRCRGYGRGGLSRRDRAGP